MVVTGVALLDEMVLFCDEDVTAADADVVVSSSGHVQYPCSAEVHCREVVFSSAVDFSPSAVVSMGVL